MGGFIFFFVLCCFTEYALLLFTFIISLFVQLISSTYIFFLLVFSFDEFMSLMTNSFIFQCFMIFFLLYKYESHVLTHCNNSYVLLITSQFLI